MIITKQEKIPSAYKHQFAWIGKDKNFIGYATGCRESLLAGISKFNKKLGYTCTLAEAKNITRFIIEAENMLKIKHSTFEYVFNKTQTGLLIIDVNPFWFRDDMRVRMHLFTILTRSGQTYKGRSFFTHAKRSKYLNVYGFYAFKRFMEGNVYYTGNKFSGWVFTFNLLNGENLEDYKRRVNFLLINSLSKRRQYIKLSEIQNHISRANSNIKYNIESKNRYKTVLENIDKTLASDERQLEQLRKRMEKLLSTVKA